MNSTHRLMCLAAALLSCSGCVTRMTNPPPAAAQPLIEVDEATRFRHFPEVDAIYPNQSTIAGTTGFYFVPDPKQPYYARTASDSGVFLLDMAMMPYTFARRPAWVPVEWRADTFAPTYTGVPPLPPPSK